jgi:UDP-GlcNAc:undecaprenyl-phosphate GlcNAc-1-phosphate transferase
VIACIASGFLTGFQGFALVLPILLAALPVLLVGAYDDLRHATPKTKVIAQLLGAAILLFANWRFGMHVSFSHALLLMFWIVLTANSFNLIDGVDGLASGTAIVIGVCLGAVNFVLGDPALGVLSLMLVASCLGFLPFNLCGPKIFLGDCGSLSLGFILAAIAFETPHGSRLHWTAIAFFGYPLAETFLTLVRRALKGRKLTRPDREHFHHKLRHSGLSAIQTTVVLALLALTFASVGLMLDLGSSRWLAVGCALILFLTVAKTFGYLRWRTVTKFKRVLRRHGEDQDLPEIVGYLPFK